MKSHAQALADAVRESVYGFVERHSDPDYDPPRIDTTIETAAPTFEVTRGVGQLTVTGANPGDKLTLIDAGGAKLITLLADKYGQANFAYIPDRWHEYETGEGIFISATGGREIEDKNYTIQNESTDPVQASEAVSALTVADIPEDDFYCQILERGLNYIEVRDGTKLAAAVHLPPETMYGEGPYPTVVEYSGYKPADVNMGAQTSMIMPLLGFAVVGVNMRGTGASGGVYDVFSRANRTDGYDIIETVAQQDWVKDGRVGMVGVSYPGIAQLITAATKPPSLVAITPMSVIDDPWRQQWPGGVYNGGFTREWLHSRDKDALEGQGWEMQLAEQGDDVCAENLKLRGQDVDFEVFARCLEFYPESADNRRMRLLVPDIDVPVYLTGAWQDEQTGSRFATMLDQFKSAPVFKAAMYNGHHPDGLNPEIIVRWYEFLSFYVARQIPKVDEMVRAMAPTALQDVFHAPVDLEEDRFAAYSKDQYDEALAAYEDEKPIRVIFENGAAGKVPGAFGGTFETHWDSFPPEGATQKSFFCDSEGTLTPEKPESSGELGYKFDPKAGATMTFAPHLGGDEYFADSQDAFMPPFVPHDWTRFEKGYEAVFQTEPFETNFVMCGPSYLDLWLKPAEADVTVEATISLLAPDGLEVRVQSGYLRLGHTEISQSESTEFWPEYTFRREGFRPLNVGEWVQRKVPIYPVTQLFRPGTRLRLGIHTPGRTGALWSFESPESEGSGNHYVGCGPDHPTRLVLPTVADLQVPEWEVDYSTIRGQPAR